MKPSDLVAGTRPPLEHKILMTAADGFDGYEITEYLGMVWGISVRAKDMGQDCLMGCKQMTGGELESYGALGDESRQQSIDRMLQTARLLRANAIINVGFEVSGLATGASQVVVHGTAVRIQPIRDYIPTGALGNILWDIAQRIGPGAPGSGALAPEAAPDAAGVQAEAGYPLAKLRFEGQKVVVVCPACQATHDVTHALGDLRYDKDKNAPGQQVQCRSCQTVSTLPER
jgi:uncharacterized protein YbjQ (UPF0145 family)